MPIHDWTRVEARSVPRVPTPMARRPLRRPQRGPRCPRTTSRWSSASAIHGSDRRPAPGGPDSSRWSRSSRPGTRPSEADACGASSRMPGERSPGTSTCWSSTCSLPGAVRPAGDPQGDLGRAGGGGLQPPADRPLIVASYDSGPMPVTYVEPVAVGDILPEMPLFLEPGSYVPAPLESTYQAAWDALPRRAETDRAGRAGRCASRRGHSLRRPARRRGRPGLRPASGPSAASCFRSSSVASRSTSAAAGHEVQDRGQLLLAVARAQLGDRLAERLEQPGDVAIPPRDDPDDHPPPVVWDRPRGARSRPPPAGRSRR